MRSLALAAILQFSLTTLAQQPVSKYAEELRIQNERTQAVSSELLEMVRQNEKDPGVIASVGRRFVTEYDGAIRVMESYRSARTRFGTQAEIDDITQLQLSLEAGKSAVHILVDGSPPPPIRQREINLVRQSFQQDVLPMIKEFVDQQFEVQGAADFLTDPGFEQAAVLVATHIRAEIRAKANAELQRIVGARINVGMSLKDHLLMAARSWISKSVGNVILRFAANHFIVERLGVKILEWIGPKLREFLRPKGNLESRVDRAIYGMRTRIGDLTRMDSDEDMLDARRMVEAAENHIRANNYLRQDLTRARQVELYERLKAQEIKLLEAIQVTKSRFLMNSKFAEIFGELTRTWMSGRRQTAAVLEKLKKELAAATGEYEAVAAGDFEKKYPGRFGLEITPTGTGFMVRVTSPSGAVIANGEFKLRRPKNPLSDEADYEHIGTTWLDGSMVPLVALHVSSLESDGTPWNGFIAWRDRQRGNTFMAVSFRKRTRGKSSPLTERSAPRQLGEFDVRATSQHGSAFPGRFGLQMSRMGTGYRIQITSSAGVVLANGEFKFHSKVPTSETVVYEHSDTGAIRIRGSSVALVRMYVYSREADGTPSTGRMVWLAPQRSNRLLDVTFKKMAR